MNARYFNSRCLVTLAIACLSTCCGSGCKSPTQQSHDGLTPVRLQLDWYPQPEHGGFFAAQLLGFYKAEGLDVTIIPLPQYGSVAQQVASGKAEIGLGSSDQVLEWDSNGLPLIAVAATMQHDPQAIMVHQDSPIHDFKDLEGQTIAAQTGATWLKYVISRYKFHEVRQVPSTLSIANFLADQHYVQQIFVTSEPFFASQARAQVRTLLISSSGYDPYRVQFTTRDFATQYPDLVERFVRASIHGWQEYLRSPQAVNAHRLALNPALNPQQEAVSAKALLEGDFVSGSSESTSQIGQMTTARWNAASSQLKELGIIQPGIDPGHAYSLKFVKFQ